MVFMALVVLVKVAVSDAAVALVLEAVEAAEARRALDFLQRRNSTVLQVAICEDGFIAYKIINVLGIRGRGMGRSTSGGDAVSEFRTAESCTGYAIDGINITLLQCMGWFCDGCCCLILDYDWVGWEQESSEPRSSFDFMAVVFFEHVLYVIVGSNRHQSIKILWDYLVLEDHFLIKLWS
jgi:hypothetical protein